VPAAYGFAGDAPCRAPLTVSQEMPHAARRLEEAHKLLDEVADMLGDVRRELLGSGNRAQ
jgi:hypothetical protein